jgi:hypothetical protein
VIIPYMCTVYLEQVHPLHYIPIPPPSPSFRQGLVGFIMLSLNVHMRYTSSLFTPQYPFHPPLTNCPDSPPYNSCPIVIIIILGLDSANEQEHEIFGLSMLKELSQVPEP